MPEPPAHHRTSRRPHCRHLAQAALIGTLLLTGTAAAQDTEQASSFAEAFFISHSVDADGGRHVEWLGSLVIWILLTTSIVSLGLIGQLASGNRRGRIMPDNMRAQASSSLRSGRYRETLTLLADDSSDFARVLHGGLCKASGGFSSMQRGMERAAGEVVARRSRPVEILNVIGQVSPMLGLFGTVYGMILAFQSIVTSGGNADPVLLAGGIGTALVTTFWGLVVAIPALAGYATIRGRLDAYQAEAINEAANIMESFRAEAPANPGESGASKTNSESNQA
ncbi:MAG: MotA/TolQ/ExbB proton channel family protein [Phycisphaerales bacterium]|nr:MotA/TolQ/ExbB proton channel family protein [Phycisphaerales bacterium]